MIWLSSVLYRFFWLIVTERRKWFLRSREAARNRRVRRLSGPHYTSLIATWYKTDGGPLISPGSFPGFIWRKIVSSEAGLKAFFWCRRWIFLPSMRECRRRHESIIFLLFTSIYRNSVFLLTVHTYIVCRATDYTTICSILNRWWRGRGRILFMSIMLIVSLYKFMKNNILLAFLKQIYNIDKHSQ